MICSRCKKPVRVAHLPAGGVIVLDPSPALSGTVYVRHDAEKDRDVVADRKRRDVTRYHEHRKDCTP